MHTTEIEHDDQIYYLHHNGGYDGDVLIDIGVEGEMAIPGNTYRIPIDVLFEFVGRAMISRDIETMEQTSGLDRVWPLR